MHLSREELLGVWRRVLDRYAHSNRPLHSFLEGLKQEPFVDDLLSNELFWGMVGQDVTREYYSRACHYIPALYATAALMAAHEDGLALTDEELALVAGR